MKLNSRTNSSTHSGAVKVQHFRNTARVGSPTSAISHVPTHELLMLRDLHPLFRWDEFEWPALEAVQELHKLSESHPENQRIIGRNKLVLEGVVHVLKNGGAKSKLWCCAVLVNLAYRSEENTAKIGAAYVTRGDLLILNCTCRFCGVRWKDECAGSVKGILSGLLQALRTRGTELTRADRCQQVIAMERNCRKTASLNERARISRRRSCNDLLCIPRRKHVGP